MPLRTRLIPKKLFKFKDILVTEGDTLRFEGSRAQIFLIHLQNKG